MLQHLLLSAAHELRFAECLHLFGHREQRIVVRYIGLFVFPVILFIVCIPVDSVLNRQQESLLFRLTSLLIDNDFIEFKPLIWHFAYLVLQG